MQMQLAGCLVATPWTFANKLELAARSYDEVKSLAGKLPDESGLGSWVSGRDQEPTSRPATSSKVCSVLWLLLGTVE
jgi:hypothetical protein